MGRMDNTLVWVAIPVNILAALITKNGFTETSWVVAATKTIRTARNLVTNVKPRIASQPSANLRIANLQNRIRNCAESANLLLQVKTDVDVVLLPSTLEKQTRKKMTRKKPMRKTFPMLLLQRQMKRKMTRKSQRQLQQRRRKMTKR